MSKDFDKERFINLMDKVFSEYGDQNDTDDTVAPEEEFVLTNKGDGYVITKYKGKRSKVIIPEEIRGRKVVEIGIGAFAGNFFTKNNILKQIVIPNSIQVIEKAAFCFCPGLETVIAHPQVKRIGNGAFEHCKALKKVDFGCEEYLPYIIRFPKELKIIGMESFFDTPIKEVSLSKRTRVGYMAFPANCAKFYYPDTKKFLGIF